MAAIDNGGAFQLAHVEQGEDIEAAKYNTLVDFVNMVLTLKVSPESAGSFMWALGGSTLDLNSLAGKVAGTQTKIICTTYDASTGDILQKVLTVGVSASAAYDPA